MRGVRVALAFLLAPFVFVIAYWVFLISFWGGASGYAYEGLGALLVGYPIGFVLVLVGGLPLLVWRMPPVLELGVFVAAGLVAAVVWILVTNGRLASWHFQFFELCAVSSGLTYPAFLRLAGLGKTA